MASRVIEALVGKLARKFSATRRRMRANAQRGSALIEFAFIAPIFFTLLLGTMEAGIIFYSQSVLQNSTTAAARLVRTGAAQGTTFAAAAKCSGSTYSGAYASAQDWFKDQICCGIKTVISSCTNLHVNVQNYTGGFGGTSFGSTADANGKLQPVTDQYAPGTSCDVVLVRTSYTWAVITPPIPPLSTFLSNMTGNNHLLVASAAFRNEPYNNGVAGC